MRQRNAGRILITGSIAGFVPAASSDLQRYKGLPQFILFRTARGAKGCQDHRDMPDAGCHGDRILPPGRHDGHECRDGKKGNGESDVVTGFKNKVQSAVANVMPAELLARQHRSNRSGDG